jgi:hypothetical protein
MLKFWNRIELPMLGWAEKFILNFKLLSLSLHLALKVHFYSYLLFHTEIAYKSQCLTLYRSKSIPPIALTRAYIRDKESTVHIYNWTWRDEQSKICIPLLELAVCAKNL